jgi:hypothetical protein
MGAGVIDDRWRAGFARQYASVFAAKIGGPTGGRSAPVSTKYQAGRGTPVATFVLRARPLPPKWFDCLQEIVWTSGESLQAPG